MVDILGYTEDEALHELIDIQNESNISADMFDIREQNGQEQDQMISPEQIEKMDVVNMQYKEDGAEAIEDTENEV